MTVSFLIDTNQLEKGFSELSKKFHYALGTGCYQGVTVNLAGSDNSIVII